MKCRQIDAHMFENIASSPLHQVTPTCFLVSVFPLLDSGSEGHCLHKPGKELASESMRTHRLLKKDSVVQNLFGH